MSGRATSVEDSVERHACPQCQAPAGSPCRTRSGATAAKYHTTRFVLVPALRDELAVLTPASRRPGQPWTPNPDVSAASGSTTPESAPIRIGYARCSTSSQELAGQLDVLEQAGCRRVFSEKISTRVRVRVRPELDALELAREIKQAAPH